MRSNLNTEKRLSQNNYETTGNYYYYQSLLRSRVCGCGRNNDDLVYMNTDWKKHWVGREDLLDFLRPIKTLEVKHDIQPENEVQIDKGEGFCYHDCTSMCRHNGCNCSCGEFHIPKN